MSNRYTAITRNHEYKFGTGIKRKKRVEPNEDEFLDPNVWAVMSEVPEIRKLAKKRKVDVVRDADNNIISINIPTDVLKKAIKDNTDVRVGLSEFDTELRDIVPESLIFNGIRIANSLEGKLYVQMTLRDEKTAVFPPRKKGGGFSENIRWLARYMPAFMVAGGIAGTGYLGYRTLKASIEVVTPEADRNRRALQSPQGLDDVVHEMAGEKPKPSHVDQQKQRQDVKKYQSVNQR